MSEKLANNSVRELPQSLYGIGFPHYQLLRGAFVEFIEIEIKNWIKYNPRTDRKTHSWFRLENSIADDQKFFGLTAAQKFGWICLLAEVSKESNTRAKFSEKSECIDGSAKINLAWIAHQINGSNDDARILLNNLAAAGLIVILHAVSSKPVTPTGNHLSPTGNHQTPSGVPTLRNVTYSTKCDGISTKHTTLEETARNEAPCNAAPRKVNAFEARFSTAYQERDLRESIFRRYPIKKGWVASWPLIRAMLVGSKDQDQLVRDMTVAADNFTAEMKRLKRAEDKIMSFQNWIKDGHWQEYINPEKSESFADDKPSGGDGWMEKAQKVLAMIRTYGDWSKYESEVRASLGDELWRTAIKARTNELRQIPNGPFQIPTFVKLLKNAHDGMEKSLPGTAG